MTDQEIKSGEYKIVNIREYGIISTKDLNNEIAISVYSPKLGKSALGRNLTPESLVKLFEELNPDNLIEPSLCDVKIVGGLHSQETEKYCEKLMDTLKKIDKDTNIIDIIGHDVGIKPHPNSIKLDCYRGELQPLERPQQIMSYEQFKKMHNEVKPDKNKGRGV